MTSAITPTHIYLCLVSVRSSRPIFPEIFLFPPVTGSGSAENCKLYGHANGSLANGGASGEEVEVEGAGVSPKQAFLTLEQAEVRDRKSTVMEVFKKVMLTSVVTQLALYWSYIYLFFIF